MNILATTVVDLRDPRHPLTWYQCVPGASGPVRSVVVEVDPMKSQSNQHAMPWHTAVAVHGWEKGMVKDCRSAAVQVRKSNLSEVRKGEEANATS